MATSTQGHCVAHNSNIVNINGVLNILADTISRLKYDPILIVDRNINFSLQQANDKADIEVDNLRWQAIARYFPHYHDPDNNEELEQGTYPNVVINNAFPNIDKEEEIFTFTIPEILDAQQAHKHLSTVCFQAQTEG